jgi:exopolyphosphatase
MPVLRRANLKPSDLITLSDLPARKKLSNTRWVLVDHNALQGELGREYKGRVVGCIDHHDEEHFVPEQTGDEPRIVEKSGSCASLVVRYCREAWDEMAGDVEGDKELAGLAMGPIVIDTHNLTSESKTTGIDREAMVFLEGKGWEGQREEFLGEIQRVKEDIGGMGLGDVLRKDYKQWTEKEGFNMGVSSVVKDMAFLIEKAGDEGTFFGVLGEFARERKLDICSIMTTSHPDGVFRRELLVWALNEKGVKAGKKFEATSRESLGLTKWKEGRLDVDGEKQWRRCWWQERVENSRKQVAPLLRTAIDI